MQRTLKQGKGERGRRRRRTARGSRGQAMIEYMVTAAMLIAIVVIASVFLYTFKAHSSRTLDLVASDYP